MMEFEYNKLTQNLLAQGYTADQFPPYVHIANTTYTKKILYEISTVGLSIMSLMQTDVPF